MLVGPILIHPPTGCICIREVRGSILISPVRLRQQRLLLLQAHLLRVLLQPVYQRQRHHHHLAPVQPVQVQRSYNMPGRKPMKVSTNAAEILKDADVFGTEVKPTDMVAKPFNQAADGLPKGIDKDGTEWVGEGIEVDRTVAKNGVFH